MRSLVNPSAPELLNLHAQKRDCLSLAFSSTVVRNEPNSPFDAFMENADHMPCLDDAVLKGFLLFSAYPLRSVKVCRPANV